MWNSIEFLLFLLVSLVLFGLLLLTVVGILVELLINWSDRRNGGGL